MRGAKKLVYLTYHRPTRLPAARANIKKASQPQLLACVMEDLGFEPRNPKERIYSPSRLASSLILRVR